MIAANLIKVLEGKGATGVEIIIDNFFKVANTKKDLSNFHTCLDIALEPCLKYI